MLFVAVCLYVGCMTDFEKKRRHSNRTLSEIIPEYTYSLWRRVESGWIAEEADSPNQSQYSHKPYWSAWKSDELAWWLSWVTKALNSRKTKILDQNLEAFSQDGGRYRRSNQGACISAHCTLWWRRWALKLYRKISFCNFSLLRTWLSSTISWLNSHTWRVMSCSESSIIAMSDFQVLLFTRKVYYWA